MSSSRQPLSIEEWAAGQILGHSAPDGVNSEAIPDRAPSMCWGMIVGDCRALRPPGGSRLRRPRTASVAAVPSNVDPAMRLVLSVFLPLAVQVLGFLGVILLSRGGGSFVGLLALGLAVLAVPLTTLVNWTRCQRLPPAAQGRLLLTGLMFALVWPLLLLVLRAVEPAL